VDSQLLERVLEVLPNGVRDTTSRAARAWTRGSPVEVRRVFVLTGQPKANVVSNIRDNNSNM